MIEQIHLAIQYLATAAISFVDKKEDDSHTNLGFSIETKTMSTRALSENGESLSFSYTHFGLIWKGIDEEKSISLDGKTHAQIIQWLEKTTAHLSKTYHYDLHYDLPYTIHNEYTFYRKDQDLLNELSQLRILAQDVFERFLIDQALVSEIRVWPHHFDTGGFVTLENGIGVGFGLGIPDTVHDDYYFYIGGYQGHDAIDPKDFSSLTNGHWVNTGFKGGVLSVVGTDKHKSLTFLNQAIANYKK